MNHAQLSAVYIIPELGLPSATDAPLPPLPAEPLVDTSGELGDMEAAVCGACIGS